MGPWGWALALLALGTAIPGGSPGGGLDFPTYDGADRVVPVTLRNYRALLKRFPVLALLHRPPPAGDRGAQRHHDMEELVLEVGTGDTVGDPAGRWGHGGTCSGTGEVVVVGSWGHWWGLGDAGGTRDTGGDWEILVAAPVWHWGHWWGLVDAGGTGDCTQVALGTMVGTGGCWWLHPGDTGDTGGDRGMLVAAPMWHWGHWWELGASGGTGTSIHVALGPL